MNRSTQWYVSGAIYACVALFIFMIRSGAEQNAFWYGTSHLPPIQVAILSLGPILIPVLVGLAIVSFIMGSSKKEVAVVGVKTLPPPPVSEVRATETPTETSEYESSCEYCKASIPKKSTFCPECGVRRK